MDGAGPNASWTRARIGALGVTLDASDGSEAYFNAHWLRDNCPTSFDRQTRERSFDIFHLAAAPEPESAEIADGDLVIVWRGENHRSRYPADFLSEYATPGPRRDVADLPRRPWLSDHYASMARFSQPALKRDAALVARWAEALIVDGVAIVEEMPDSDVGLTETALMLGQIRPTFFGPYFDVRVQIDPINLAYTSAALEMHTDVPAEEQAPGVQFLHCRANSVDGGRSLFVDGLSVAEDYRALDPDGFELLATTEIPFYNEHDDYDMRARQTVIERDASGAVTGLTISQHLLDVIDLPQRDLDRYYPAFCRFGRMLQDDKYVMKFRLNAGECIVFDNHRIVHGREGYTAESGERYLRGTYVDRAEVRSTYRAIMSRGVRRFL